MITLSPPSMQTADERANFTNDRPSSKEDDSSEIVSKKPNSTKLSSPPDNIDRKEIVSGGKPMYTTLISLLHIVAAATFWLFLIVTFVQHLYLDYYELIIKSAGRAANKDAIQQDYTYYYRSCSAADLTVKTKSQIPDLLLNESTLSGPEVAVDHMMRHGVSFIPHVLSSQAVRDLRGYIVKRNTYLTEEESIWVHPPKNRQVFAIDPVEDESVMSALKEIGNHKILKPMLEGLVGPDPAITELSSITVHPRAKAQNWHHDVQTSGSAIQFARTHSHSYSMFIALQDTKTDMGPTRVCPGTHYCCNNVEELCNRKAVIPSTFSNNTASSSNSDNEDDDVFWPAGYGTIFNQQTWHRGEGYPAAKSKLGPSRIMFVISFTSRPKIGYDNRQLSRGLFCFVRWDIWGHTFQDLLDPRKHMTRLSRMLRALSIWKPSDRNWGLDYLTKTAMEVTLGENGAEPWRLSEIIEDTGIIPSFLHGPISEDDEDAWTVYMKQTLQNTWIWLLKMNVVLVVAILSLTFATNPSRQNSHKAIIGWSVLAYGLPCVILAWQVHRVKNTEWGQSVINRMAFRSPFPEFEPKDFVPDPSHPTTLPENYDVLMGTRYDSPFLGAFDRWLEYHPGNLRYRNAIQKYGPRFESYKGLPNIFRGQIITIVSDDVFQPGRLLLQDWKSGDWKVLPKEEMMQNVRNDLKLSSKPLLRLLDDKIRKQLAHNRFSTLHRGQRIAFESQEYLTDVKKQILLDRDNQEGYADTGVRYATSPKASTMRIRKLAMLEQAMRKGASVAARTINRNLKSLRASHNEESIRYKRGDLIAVPDKENEWVKGTITKVNKGGTVNIEFNDGKRSTNVDVSLLRMVIPIVEGLPIKIFLNENEKPKRGTVIRVLPSGRIDARYKVKKGKEKVTNVKRKKYFPMAYWE